jgi:hypothetical protein
MAKGTNSRKRQKKVVDTPVVNPFSETFWDEHWLVWKQYKREQFNFTYKGAISEQAALNNLCELSEGNEQVAARIIKQSYDNGWRGLFALRNNDTGRNRGTGGPSGGGLGGDSPSGTTPDSAFNDFHRQWSGGGSSKESL